jgi:hypothetical protein
VNLFTGAVIVVLVLLSVILTASVPLPDQANETAILTILGGSALALVAALASGALKPAAATEDSKIWNRARWREPPARAAWPGSNVPRDQNLDDRSARVPHPGGGLVLVRIISLSINH